MAFPRDLADANPDETREWLDALEYLLDNEGTERANFLLERLSARMAQTGARLPYTITTPYRNTIPANKEAFMPGDLFMERRIRSLIRWNALAMVMRANQSGDDLGGHIATFSSAATLYDVGFNYFFRAPTDDNPGDLIYYQGHSSPGIYARSFLEGRLDEDDLDRFRREVDGKGLSSYPHPWLMPDYWQFPTVSMGLGPIQAIYQAHIMKYLDSRGLVPMGDRKVWAFLGDGECDEPESLGVLGPRGARETRQPDFRRQLQPAAPRRTRARQRQDHSGTRRNISRCRLECDQGGLGATVGSALCQRRQRLDATAHERDGRRRVSELQSQGRRVYARALLRQVARTVEDGGEPFGRRHHAAEPRRPRSVQGVCRISRGGEPPRRAHRDSGQDRQRVWNGRGR